ncbi:MAG: hypothetical protein JO283_04045 [Bradyrhizobium sp.]|nr:hypothetical protein [Bradyrhizobium sp.]
MLHESRADSCVRPEIDLFAESKAAALGRPTRALPLLVVAISALSGMALALFR